MKKQVRQSWIQSIVIEAIERETQHDRSLFSTTEDLDSAGLDCDPVVILEMIRGQLEHQCCFQLTTTDAQRLTDIDTVDSFIKSIVAIVRSKEISVVK